MMFRFVVNQLMIILLVFMLPATTLAADLEITEIMYDPEGSDTDYEWIEVQNISDTDIDLSDWDFTVESEGDSSILPSDNFAVIARSPVSFQSRYDDPDIHVFGDISTLNNSGDTVTLTNDTVEVSATYEPQTDADGNGASLQLHDGEWVAADPTPGAENTTESSTGSDDGKYQIEILEPREDPPPVEEVISIDAGDDKPAIVGLPVELNATITGISDHRQDDLDVSWSLGNGDHVDGKEVTYTYQYPGEYVATLQVQDDDGNTYTDTTGVEVLDADFSIKEVVAGSDGYVAIENTTGRAVDISGWQLRSLDSGKTFTFPPHTIHLDDEQITITNNVSGLSGGDTELLLPDDTVVASYQPEDPVTAESQNTTSYSQRTYSSAAAGSGSAQSNADEDQAASEPEADTSADGEVAGTSAAAGGELSLTEAFAATQTAAAAGSRQARSDAFWQWGGMLMLLLITTVGTTILLRRVSKSNLDPLVQASKFDINEIND